jgi:plasmid maintenance system antidote protein VapI
MNLRVPANRIAEIVKGERAISADTALRLARYLGTSAEFWLGLQSDYELEKLKMSSRRKSSARFVHASARHDPVIQPSFQRAASTLSKVERRV